MKRPASFSLLLFGLLLFSVNLSLKAQCDFSSDFSSSAGWTQVGSEVEIQNGAVHFLNGAKCREYQKRVQAPLGSLLNEGDCWEARIEFTPTSVGVKNNLPYTGHVVLGLTAGTNSFHFDCPDPPCTGHNPGDQDAIMVHFIAQNPPTGQLFFRVTAKDDFNHQQSNQIIALPLGSTHYIEVRKSAINSVELSIYSDSLYTQHLAGSPATLNYTGSVDSLTHVQFGNTIRGESRRQLTGTLDNLCIRWSVSQIAPINFPKDTTICANDTLTLNIGKGSSYVYSWNTGSTDSILTISDPGTYIATISGPCQAISDTIVVHKTPELKGQLSDLTICEGETAILTLPSTNASYIWSTGETTSSIQVSSSGLYSVIIQNECDSIYDEAFVTVEDCSCEITLPNIFTPNGDGNNDFFVAIQSNPNCAMDLKVFNRWGSMVFHTKQHDFSWGGDDLPQGTYYWTLTYRDLAGNEQSDHGSVTISR